MDMANASASCSEVSSEGIKHVRDGRARSSRMHGTISNMPDIDKQIGCVLVLVLVL